MPHMTPQESPREELTWSRFSHRPTPVCRIMDYGKYLYQQEKKEREARSIRPNRGEGGEVPHNWTTRYETKKNHVLRSSWMRETGPRLRSSSAAGK